MVLRLAHLRRLRALSGAAATGKCGTGLAWEFLVNRADTLNRDR